MGGSLVGSGSSRPSVRWDSPRVSPPREQYEEWPSLGVVEVDEELTEHAARLTLEYDLRSFDALHLAAALLLPPEGLVLATWDRRLHSSAQAHQLDVLPQSLP